MHCMDGEWKCVARGDSDARGKKEKREKSSSLPSLQSLQRGVATWHKKERERRDRGRKNK